MSGTSIKVNLGEVQALFQRLGSLDQRAILDEIGQSNVSATTLRFKRGVDPEGNRWEEHSAVTLEMKAKRGITGKSAILVDRGHLRDSITHQVSLVSQSVMVGTNRIYARIHQLGGMAGRNRKVKIPARPYLGVSKDDAEEYLDITRDYIARLV